MKIVKFLFTPVFMGALFIIFALSMAREETAESNVRLRTAADVAALKITDRPHGA